MISYNSLKKTYSFDKDKLSIILDYLKSNPAYFDMCKEDLVLLGTYLKEFMDSIVEKDEEVVLQRQETLEEAKDALGEDFIQFYENLITRLDDNNTVIALHGTREESAKMILESGLKYKSPALGSTALVQEMPFGNKDFKVDSYPQMLNWPHLSSSFLVMVAIPYECLYEKGLWEKTHEKTSQFDQNYVIRPEFILGYIDINGKTFVMNPSYTRNHDYTKLEFDMDIYHKDPNMTPEVLKESMRRLDEEVKAHKESSQSAFSSSSNENVLQVDEGNYKDILQDKIEDLLGYSNGLFYMSDNIINNESVYKSMINAYKAALDAIMKSQVFALTRKEMEEKAKAQAEAFASVSADFSDSDFWDFGSDFSWDEGVGKEGR